MALGSPKSKKISILNLVYNSADALQQEEEKMQDKFILHFLHLKKGKKIMYFEP